MPDFLSARQVPDLDNPVSTAAGEVVKRFGVFGHRVDPIDVSVAELRNKGCGEHPFQFGGIQGPGVFSSSLERMNGRVEIARLSNNIRSRGLMGSRRTCEGLDFLKGGFSAFAPRNDLLRFLTMVFFFFGYASPSRTFA